MDRLDVETMLGLVRHRGPDGLHVWSDGPVAMGYAALKTTPEAMAERQPVVDEEAGLCLTLDGRIDGRRELRASLGLSDGGLTNATDAELVLHAYRKWGTACVERLLGEFSFALWDERRRQLFCARDFLGKRPFYYRYDGRSFRWASEPQQILARPDIPRQPNEGYLGELLSGAIVSTCDTVFEGLCRLPPAHALTVSDHGLRLFRHWRWDPDLSIRYGDDRQYAEHLRQILEEVLLDHLRSSSPVALFLSGGLDSSSLLGLATHLRRQGRTSAALETYSMVFPDRGHDESAYIDEVLAACPPDASHRDEPHARGAAYFEAQVRRYLDLPEYPNGAMSADLTEKAVERGCRVGITGEGGDHWFTGSSFYYSDLLRQMRFPTLLRLLRQDPRGPAYQRFWKLGVLPLVPDGLRHRASAVLGRHHHPPWMPAPFCRRIGLMDRIRSPLFPGRAPLSLLDTVRWIGHGLQVHHNEVAERSASWAGYELRDPLSDRRLVEFALAIPEEQRQRDGERRYVQRNAVAGLIPESVRRRQTKAEFWGAFADEFAAQGGPDLFRHLVLEDLGWVDSARVRAMYAEFSAVGPDHRRPWIWELALILALERWVCFVLKPEAGSIPLPVAPGVR